MTTPARWKTKGRFADYFLAARRLAQIAFNLAESLALVAALILPLDFFGAGAAAALAGWAVPLTRAQRALAAAEILALAAALILNFFLPGCAPAVGAVAEPNNRLSSFSSD